MPAITIDLEELKKERNKHLEAIKHLDYMIERFFGQEKSQNCENTANIDNTNQTADKSRMQKALEVCVEYLKQGNTVRTMRQFLEIIEKNGIILSRGGLSLAFKKPNSNIYFDTSANMWKLKNQG